MEFIESEKKHKMLVYEGYLFYKDKVHNSTTYWNCSEKRKAGCKARIHTVENERLANIAIEHNHSANAPKVAGKVFMSNLKRKASVSDESTQKVIKKELATVPDSVSPHLPSTSSMTRTVQRTRETKIDMISYTNRQDLILPENFKVTLKNEKFLLYDSGLVSERILIFSTVSNLSVLARSKTLYVDGTFKTTPLLFTQLFTIHGVDEKISMPLVYALLPNKTQSTYIELFEELKKLNSSINPEKFVLDFEMAISNAILKVFPCTSIHYCLFHLGQSLYRKLSQIDLKLKYDTDSDFAQKVKMVMALAFVPTIDVVKSFEDLLAANIMPAELDLFLDYFEDNYIGRHDVRVAGNRRVPRYPAMTWNVYELTINNFPRTNNSVEGWHTSFQNLVGCHHPTIGLFIKSIQLEQSKTEVELQKILSGETMPNSRKKYRDLNERLINVCNKYQTLNIIDFLTGIANNLAL